MRYKDSCRRSVLRLTFVHWSSLSLEQGTTYLRVLPPSSSANFELTDAREAHVPAATERRNPEFILQRSSAVFFRNTHGTAVAPPLDLHTFAKVDPLPTAGLADLHRFGTISLITSWCARAQMGASFKLHCCYSNY